MKKLLPLIRTEHFLWGVVLGKLIADPTFPWAAAVVVALLLAKPLVESYFSRVAFGREVTEQKVAVLEQKLTDVQNRIASLSLAAGFKRQGS